jgi:hypothetical protein
MRKVLIFRLAVTLALSSTLTLYPQGSRADNLPADTTYSAGIDTLYNNGFVPASNELAKVANLPTGNQPRTSTKYKAWAKRMNSAYAKIGTYIPKLLALNAGLSYTKSDSLLRKYLLDYKSFITLVSTSIAKAKVSSAENALLTKNSKTLGLEGNAWIAQYEIDFGVANVKAPAAAPSISFSTATTAPGSLYATLSDNALFSAQALGVTSYVIEWYIGSASSEPITSTGTIIENGYKKQASFELTGVVIGGTYLARVAALNSGGQGAWSQLFNITLP